MKKKDFATSLMQGGNKGFTLAETLIALVVIGIVAAIILPAMSTLIQTKVRERQVEVAKIKFTKALEQMTLQEKLGPQYADTLDFVNELRNHFKINYVCRVGDSPSELPPVTSCFGDNYENILMADGTTFPIESIKTGAQFRLDDNDNNDWSSDNIAFMTVDGVRFIASYNKKCTQTVYDHKVFSGTTVSQNCVSGLVDIDGDKKPNALNKDVFLFGMAKSIGNSCATGTAQGLCFSTAIDVSTFTSTTYDECMTIKGKYGITEDICGVPDQPKVSGTHNQWYAGLVDFCGGPDKIADATDIAKMVGYIYGTNVTADALLEQNADIVNAPFNESRAEEYGLVAYNYVVTGDLTESFYSKGVPQIMLQENRLRTTSSLAVMNVYGLYNGPFAYCKL